MSNILKRKQQTEYILKQYNCKIELWHKILCHCPKYIPVNIPVIYIYDNPIKSFLSQNNFSHWFSKFFRFFGVVWVCGRILCVILFFDFFLVLKSCHYSMWSSDVAILRMISRLKVMKTFRSCRLFLRFIVDIQEKEDVDSVRFVGQRHNKKNKQRALRPQDSAVLKQKNHNRKKS